MKCRTMGKLGIQTSAFGLGCMHFNGAASSGSVIDEQKAVSLIRRAIDGGVTYPKWDWALQQIKKQGSGADKCAASRACESAYPQHLNIIDELQRAWRELHAE